MTAPAPALSSGSCPIAQRLALAEAARRVLELNPCPLSADLAVRLAAVARYGRARTDSSNLRLELTARAAA